MSGSTPVTIVGVKNRGRSRRHAARFDFRAVHQGVGKQRLYLFDGIGIDQRADRRLRIAARRDVKLCCGFVQAGDEAVVNTGLYENAVSTDAGLSGVAEFRRHRAGDRLS